MGHDTILSATLLGAPNSPVLARSHLVARCRPFDRDRQHPVDFWRGAYNGAVLGAPNQPHLVVEAQYHGRGLWRPLS